MSPDKSEPRVLSHTETESRGPFTTSKTFAVVSLEDYDQAIQLKDARIADLEAEIDAREKSHVETVNSVKSQLQQKLTEAEKENERLFNLNVSNAVESDLYKTCKSLEKRNNELKDELFFVERKLEKCKELSIPTSSLFESNNKLIEISELFELELNLKATEG